MFEQKIHVRAILGYLGILLHIPAIIGLITLAPTIYFGEYFALIPLGITIAISIALGQTLFWLFYSPHTCHLWDAMLIAALGWLVIPLIGSIPLAWIISTQPQSGDMLATYADVFFESMSTYTSTGLTMIAYPENAPNSLLFWRSLSCWFGGMGLLVFILQITTPKRAEYRLYYAEARTENIGENIAQTSRIIWIIYIILTGLGIMAYAFAGMPVWEAINNGLTSISTGGFTLRSTSFASFSIPIKVVACSLMLLGSMDIALYYFVVTGRISVLWKNAQQILLYIVLTIGGLTVLFLAEEHTGSLVFNWISALTTTGFSAYPIQSTIPTLKLLFILGMFIGGSTGSTAGGIKLTRLRHLLEGIVVRIRGITDEHERYILSLKNTQEGEEAGFGLPMGEGAERLYAAGILLTMWFISLFSSWFLMLFFVPERLALQSFFEVFSAMSNCGLSMGIMNPSFPALGKFLYTVLMYIGRLELLPALILVSSILIPHNAQINAE